MTRWNNVMLALCVGILTAACGPDPVPQDGVVGPPPGDDIGFEATTADATREPATDALVADMMVHNRAAVELGHLAREQAQTSEVRELAARIARDHQQANAQLADAAAGAGIEHPAPEADPGEVYRMRERLEQLSGAEFDREYMRLTVEQHEKAIRTTEYLAERAEHEQIRQWAGETLPALRTHLEEAR